ncbi:Uncharacterised protein [Anaerococcus prevotii]|uniref:DUF3784 domain-containing protein n=1 Tax=Anaerococcus prevotii (strain ATCC 9321 / DSM 20548 / JCM 6508 / NCTC 11806 / PC1) TaxID=525919 RepID=C7RI04_ANAPD|nr:hypothetical protein [Anaerococcus prevotii]ACV29115.1 hypothetical protein Apre_1088 [Anaerococcus prevotii DSM 20548]SUU94789.1 Uncharacterised protein [Anaerococcus prevotii]
MKVFALMLALTGLVFLFFGYKIYFKKSYDLINGFEKDYKKGLKDENYAIRVGKIYFLIFIAMEILAIYILS